jgi:hypothetical protein
MDLYIHFLTHFHGLVLNQLRTATILSLLLLLLLGKGQVESSCEFSDEPLGSIKCWEIIQWLYN